MFDHFTLTLIPGELIHLQGVNGSGKTSLLRILAGLSSPESGIVRWNGVDIQECRDEYVSHLLYLGHQPAVKDDLTVRENLQVSCRLAGLEPSAESLRSALEETGLLSRSNLPARVLSQGQRRRLALSRLWLENRRLWILDEPFTALDVHATQLLERRLEAHLAAGGMVILTTHQQPDIAEDYLRILGVGT